MKKTIKHLLLPSFIMIGSIAFSQNAETNKQNNNVAKPTNQLQATTKNELQSKAKPAASIANQHSKIVDKKSAVKQSESAKK